MKTRLGFVSNSSSSSFIVQCKPTKQSIKNEEELKVKFDDLFGYDDEDEYIDESYKEYLDFAQKCWDDGDGVLFEYIEQGVEEELSDIFDKMGLKCMFPDY